MMPYSKNTPLTSAKEDPLKKKENTIRHPSENIVKQFCLSQIKCKEDTPQTWTCCAHLAEGRADKCHYSEEMIKTIKHRDTDGNWRERRIMSSRGEGLGQCVDWEPVAQQQP